MIKILDPDNIDERTKKLLPWGVVFLGLIIRLITLGSKSFYVDEGITLFFATKPLDKIVPLMIQTHEVHPPLYFWFCGIWYRMWDIFSFLPVTFEGYIRFSSVIFAVLGIYMVFLLGKELFSYKIGIISSFLVSISSFHIYYSQELRMYPILLFFILCSFYYFFRLAKERTPKNYLFFTISTALALITHYYAFYIYFVLGLFLLMEFICLRNEKETKGNEKKIRNAEHQEDKKSKETGSGKEAIENKAGEIIGKNGGTLCEDDFCSLISSGSEFLPLLKGITISLFIAGISFLFWIPYFFKQLNAQNFMLRPPPRIGDFFEIFSQLFMGFTLIEPKIFGMKLLIWISVIPLLIIAIYSIKAIKSYQGRFTLLYLLLPIIISIVTTLSGRFNIFEFKYFFIILPPFWIITAVLISRHEKITAPVLIPLLVLIILFLNIFTSYNFLSNPFYWPQEWKRVAKLVEEKAQPDDLVIVHPSMMSPSFLIYYRGKARIYPLDEIEKERLASALKSRGGVWLAYTPYHPYIPQAGLVKTLYSLYPLKETFTLPNFRPSGVLRVDYFQIPQEENPPEKKK